MPGVPIVLTVLPQVLQVLHSIMIIWETLPKGTGGPWYYDSCSAFWLWGNTSLGPLQGQEKGSHCAAQHCRRPVIYHRHWALQWCKTLMGFASVADSHCCTKHPTCPNIPELSHLRKCLCALISTMGYVIRNHRIMQGGAINTHLTIWPEILSSSGFTYFTSLYGCQEHFFSFH